MILLMAQWPLTFFVTYPWDTFLLLIGKDDAWWLQNMENCQYNACTYLWFSMQLSHRCGLLSHVLKVVARNSESVFCWERSTGSQVSNKKGNMSKITSVNWSLCETSLKSHLLSVPVACLTARFTKFLKDKRTLLKKNIRSSHKNGADAPTFSLTQEGDIV